MKLSPERIEALASQLVERLTAERMLEPVLARKALASSLAHVVENELKIEDRINAEAKELMRKYEGEIARGQLNEQQLFQMIKKQLVKEKGVIL
jgi:hypothetical protein